MPEIDRDLFQALALGGLLVLIILMILAVGMLRSIAARSGGAESHSRRLEVVPVIASHDEAEHGNQPFEQNGRWFFHRGGELLVYEETTGEWLSTQAEPEPEVTPEPEVAIEPPVAVAVAKPGVNEGFWKCTTCAAVNSLSAASCRMCFSARP